MHVNAQLFPKSSNDPHGITNLNYTCPLQRHGFLAVGIIDTETDRVIKILKVGEAPWRTYASPDGRFMMVPNSGDETISIIDVTTQEVVTTLQGGAGMTGVDFTQGGKKAYVISGEEGRRLSIRCGDFQESKPFKAGSQFIS